MITLMDWLVQLEHSRTSLNRSGQERLALLEYSNPKVSQTAKIETIRPAAQAVTAQVHCCPEATA